MDVTKILKQIQQGTLSVAEGTALLKDLPYQTLGDFAKIDHHRTLRSGFSEVIFCSGKSTEHLLKIYQSFHQKGENLLGTRCSEAQFEALKGALPALHYDPLSRILKLEPRPAPLEGCVALCTGGTSDWAVAEEAAQVAEFFGTTVLRFHDVGVAGIHRLFDHLPQIRSANCIIAVAGMEGALPGVLAGLVERPVIAVPTSVGYGASFGGLSALLTMLNSCAEGISVVNIDNGFGAGYQATQINRLALGR